MLYQDGMVDVESGIMDQVLSARANFQPGSYTADDVRAVVERIEAGPLGADPDLTADEFAVLLSPAASSDPALLERIAQLSRAVTQAHFGNSVALFTPLYLANYCQSNCIYCGFSLKNKINRIILTDAEIGAELEAIAATGLQEILLLTGESWVKSSPEWIADAASKAHKLFKNVQVEVYPMNVEDYALMHERGVDYVTVFQETYDPVRYSELHLSGQKRSFPFRFNAQERALVGGMRGVAFGALLGIGDFRADALAVGLHATLIQRKFPHAEISLSVPRLRPATGNDSFIDGVEIAGGVTKQTEEERLLNPHGTQIQAQDVTEADLVQIICAYRLMVPFANITVSTREDAHFRDNAVRIGATKVSAGVDTGIGRHSGEEDGDAQFDISDTRTVDEISDALRAQGLQPVINDHIFV
jgi:2-iminoacetate synthase